MLPIMYTDTDRIRSVLGIDEADLADDAIVARDLNKELRLDLLSWIPDHQTHFEAADLSTATEEQISIADAITLYATYYCSVLVVKSLQLAAPQMVSDGKNTLSRFTPMDWQALYNYLAERAAFYRSLLLDLISTPLSSAPYNPLSGVGLSVDPVKEGIA